VQKLGGESQPLYTVDVLVNLTQGSYYPSATNVHSSDPASPETLLNSSPADMTNMTGSTGQEAEAHIATPFQSASRSSNILHVRDYNALVVATKDRLGYVLICR
jgi:hypothetical protein